PRSNKAGGRTGLMGLVLGAGEQAGVIDGSSIPSLQSNHFLEFLQGFAATDHLLSKVSAVFQIAYALAYQKHPRRKDETKLTNISWAFAAQHVNAFGNFQRVADGTSQWLVHAGDQSHRALAQAQPGFHHD